MKKKKDILSVVGFLLFIYFLPLTSFGQEGKILPGFDKVEFMELLKISSYQGDTPAPARLHRVVCINIAATPANE